MKVLDHTVKHKNAAGREFGPFEIIPGAMMTDGIRTWHRDGRFLGVRLKHGHHFDLIDSKGEEEA